MTTPIRADAKWPAHVLGLCLRLAAVRRADRSAASTAAMPAWRGEVWVALRDAMVRLLRGSRLATGVCVDDLEDLASAKALELILRAEQGEWVLEGRSTAEFVGYLAAVVRNALADHGKRAARMVSDDDLPEEVVESRTGMQDKAAAGADEPAMAREFLAGLRECVASLQPRARRVWFYRVFYDMTTRDIALHPQVVLQAPHVDVILQRARDSIRSCMQLKGFEPQDLPGGAFAHLWECLQSLAEAAGDPLAPEVEIK